MISGIEPLRQKSQGHVGGREFINSFNIQLLKHNIRVRPSLPQKLAHPIF